MLVRLSPDYSAVKEKIDDAVGKTFTLHTLSMSCPEPIPKAELALEDRCWPRSDPWPDLLSGRLKHERYNYSHDFSPR